MWEGIAPDVNAVCIYDNSELIIDVDNSYFGPKSYKERLTEYVNVLYLKEEGE
jgi:hypothetical protein